MRWALDAPVFLHLVDGFDEVEEGFGALGLVGDFASGLIGWLYDCVIF